MPLVYLSLEIPKLIINDAISGDKSSFQILFVNLSQIEYLFALSFVFLALVIANGILKYLISVYQGVLGERMLRRFRYMLYCRILRFPLPHIKKASSGEFISMVTAESEPLGGFIGDSIALPVFQGGLLITYVYFIFVQNVFLGLASIAFYPLQIYLIPRLQKRVNELSRQRVSAIRKLADRVDETFNAATDIKVNDGSRFERADISKRLGRIFTIRLNIYRKKFFIKFLNNFLGHLTPFFFYGVGGYFVIKGELTLGALVAVLAAYKDIGPPWKELLKFYQIMEDIKVKYAQIIRQFEPKDMIPLAVHTDVPESPQRFNGPIVGKSVSLTDKQAPGRLGNLTFDILLDQHTGVSGQDYESISEFLLALTGLDPPISGVLEIDNHSISSLSEYVRGRNIGYCTANSYIMNTSVRNNLYYGVKNQPEEGLETLSLAVAELKEAQRSGNSLHNANSRWLDIGGAGFENQAQFDRHVDIVLDAVELTDDLVSLALESQLDNEKHGELIQAVVDARGRVKTAVDQVSEGQVIENFDPSRYNSNLTVAENLLFGTPIHENVTPYALARLPEVSQVLVETRLQDAFINIGINLATLMLELFGNVDLHGELVARYSFIEASRFDEYRAVVEKTAKSGIAACNPSEQTMLISLTMQLSPAKHNLDLVSPEIQQQIVQARKLVIQKFGEVNETIRFIDEGSYQSGMSVRENLLFGVVAYNKRHLVNRIDQQLRGVLSELGLTTGLVHRGLRYRCGNAGSNLSQAFRQKLALARALVKNADILIVDDGLSTIDMVSQKRILANIMQLRKNKNLVWRVVDKDTVPLFDRNLRIEDGVISVLD
ncbi:MAG: ATP-binding cassette domain-containing protein [Gammaproteobacteria bacterium]|nr:ATP-binding cassette domain-containing protein [Gammaproteobacteria bacterium]